ncbi:MAG: hypothetical protein MUP90_03715 [Gammaproteobacteria bacterium]|nr:hypothetical protein [Gammaproteobacteria bacterium]
MAVASLATGLGGMNNPKSVSVAEVTEALGGVEGMPGTCVLAMECGGRRVVSQLSVLLQRAWLFLPGETLQMMQWSYDDRLVLFHGTLKEMAPIDMQVTGEVGEFQVDWQAVMTKDEVWLEQEGTRIDCQVNRPETRFEAAKLGAADFRGLGNEPGWELVIWSDRMRLNDDYGASQFEVPLVGEPETLEDETGSRVRGQVDDRVLDALLQRGPCHDSMSDQVFETRVSVSLDGRNFTGCGKALH